MPFVNANIQSPRSSNSNPPFPKVKRDKESSDLVLLTSSFRPSELIHRVSTTERSTTSAPGNDTSDWEFVPARVPDGISLRNFGIQVVGFTFLHCPNLYSSKAIFTAHLCNPVRYRRLFSERSIAQCYCLSPTPSGGYWEETGRANTI